MTREHPHVRLDAGDATELAEMLTFIGDWLNSDPVLTKSLADFVGSTGGMMKYVRATTAPYFLMLTECGLVGRLEVEEPGKNFVGGCRLCPYMKLNSLEKIRDVLAAPRPHQVVTLDDDLRRRAARCIERMFELAPTD